MIDYHVSKKAEVTVAAIPVHRNQAIEFGVIEAAGDGRIMAFHEKKANAPTMPGDANRVYASMGNYIFSTQTLLDLLTKDAKDPNSRHASCRIHPDRERSKELAPSRDRPILIPPRK